MNNVALKDIKNYAAKRLQQAYGYCGIAGGQSVAFLNSGGDAERITIEIKCDKTNDEATASGPVGGAHPSPTETRDMQDPSFLNTAGPWRHAEDFGQVGSIETADGVCVAQAQAIPGDVRSAQRTANAKLLAAAPALRDTALNFLGLFNNPIFRRKMGDDTLYQEVIAQARAAVAQSLGEAPAGAPR